MNTILEKVVHNQLTDFLCGNNILDIFSLDFGPNIAQNQHY